MPDYYIPKKEFKVYTTKEIYPYIKFAKSKDMKVLVALAFLTGARISELLMLRKRDFQLDKEADELRIVLKTLKRKGDFWRELTFSIKADPFVINIVVPYIRRFRSDESRLFRLSKRSYQLKLQRLNEFLHGEDYKKYIVFHQLRHSAITYLARDLRASAWEIASWTGHKSTAYEEYMIHGAARRFKGRMKR